MENETATCKRGRGIFSCRYCSATEDCYRNICSIYSWKGSEEVYSKIILETFNVTVFTTGATSDTISLKICESCVARLRDAWEFKKLVQNVEEMLQQQLQALQNLSKIGEIDAGPAEVEKEVECQVKEEVDSFDDNRSPVFEDLSSCQESVYIEYPDSKIVKEEPLFKNLQPVRKIQSNSKHKTTGIKTGPAKKTRKKHDKSRKKKTKDAPQNNDNGADDVVRKNSIALLRHSTVYPFQPTKKSFRCCFCPYTPQGYEPSAFRLHMDTTHRDIDKSTCLKHHNESMRRVDITNLKCKDCDNVFYSLEDLAKHLVEVHKHDIDLSQDMGLVPIRLENDRFACVICCKSYTTLHQLSRHSGTHFYRNICYKCGGNFETLKGLKKHVIFAHSKHKFLCQKCKMPFPDLNSKKEHMRNSTKCQSFKCKLCKETFLCLETQQEHLVKVHGEAKVTYPCPECGDVFEKRIRRYLHFKMAHTDDFKCSHCGTKFSNNRCLQDHIARIHTFERKYRCTICDKTFIDARTLRTHTFIHDASKKQPCPVCNRAFTMKIRLKYHVQKYHPDVVSTVFPAPFCESKKV